MASWYVGGGVIVGLSSHEGVCRTGTASVCVAASLTRATIGDNDDDGATAAAGRRRGGNGLGGVQVVVVESVPLVESGDATGDSLLSPAISRPSRGLGRVSAT